MKKQFQKIILVVILGLMGFSNNTFAQTSNWQWAVGAGKANDEDGASITTDASGNIYTTGSFSSPTIAIGTSTLSRFGFGNVLVVKQDASGNVVWAKNFGGTSAFGGGGNGKGICVDANGNVYVTGFYLSSLVIGSTTLTTTDSTATNVGEIFVTKLDANGNIIWAKSAGGTVGDFANGVCVDANNNVYIVGLFKSHSLKFGPITLTSPNNTATNFFISTDIFIAKYDVNGNEVWAKNAGTSGIDEGKGICTDADGNVLITGSAFMGSLTFGSITLNLTSGYNLFLTKYDTNGNVIWAKTAVGSGTGGINHLAASVYTDSNKNVFVTGSFNASTLTFSNITLNRIGSGSDFYIAKYDASGNPLWAKNSGGSNVYGTGITTDPSGNSYVTGYFDGLTCTFGTNTLTNNNTGGNNEDIFIGKYDASGTLSWVKSVGGTYRDISYGIGVTPNGDACIAGKFTSNTLAFGGTTLTNGGIGYSDIFIAKLGAPVLVKEFTNSHYLEVYPNPTSGLLHINFKSENNTPNQLNITVLNVMGEMVHQSTILDQVSTIDLQRLNTGVYFIEITTKEKAYISKFIKE